METVLITEQLIKDNSPISNNVDITDITPYISITQKLYIEPILGIPLVDELKEQIKNNSLTPENGDLILALAPCFSYYISYQSLPFLWAKILNKGITKGQSPENSDTVTMKEMGQLRSYLLSDAQTLRSQFINWLCNCRAHYTNWLPDDGCGCGCDDKENNGSTKVKYNSGMSFYHKNRQRKLGDF